MCVFLLPCNPPPTPQSAYAYTHTVTRIDVIFRYPDRVPLTHFLHRAKKFLACEPEFYVDFSAPPEFSGGVMEKSLSTGANLRSSDYEPGVLPLRHCSLVMTISLFLAGIFRPFLYLPEADFSGRIW